MIDPWASPNVRPPDHLQGADFVAGHVLPGVMTMRSVPDGRAPVPLIWWVPVVAVLMLGGTTWAILPGQGLGLGLLAIAVSIIGYLAVWAVIRPQRLRTGPYPRWRSAAGMAPMDRIDPPTLVLPLVPTQRPRRLRNTLLLLNSAAVLLGMSLLVSIIVGLVLRPANPSIASSRTSLHGLELAVINALATSILEECGMAVLILAVAGLAQQFLPRHWDSRSVGIAAILAATIARTALHVPLWGVGAVARIGLSFLLGWLYWRTRRVWPLIVAHTLWDTFAIETVLSPSVQVKGYCALVIFGWAVTAVVIGTIAVVRSSKQARRALP